MRRLVIALVAMGMGLVATASPAPASVTENHGVGSLQLGSAFSFAGQTFTVPAAPVTDNFLARLVIDRYVPRSGPFTVAVSAVNAGGLPTGPALWTSGPMTTSADGSVVVYPSIQVTPGTQYAVYMSHASSAGVAGTNLSDDYAGGKMVTFNANTGAWTGQPGDLNFRAEFNYGVAYTDTALTCTPATVVIGHQTTCTATVTEIGNGNLVPNGIINIATNQAIISDSACDLVNGSCSFTFTPLGATGSTPNTTFLKARFNQTGTHFESSVTLNYPITKRSTSTAVSCTPTPLEAGQTTTCTATVADTQPTGISSTPIQAVAFTSSAAGSFSAPSCLLMSGQCSVTFTPTASGPHTVSGAYAGDLGHATSTGTAPVWVRADQSIAFSTNPPAQATVGTAHDINATGGGSGQPVTFALHSSSSAGACSVNTNSGLVQFLQPGTCVIAANQAGNANYYAAPQKLYPAMTVKRGQTVDTSRMVRVGYVGSSPDVYHPSGVAGAATMTSTTPAVCTVTNKKVTYLTAGSCVLSVTVPGNATYWPGNVLHTITVYP